MNQYFLQELALQLARESITLLKNDGEFVLAVFNAHTVQWNLRIKETF